MVHLPVSQGNHFPRLRATVSLVKVRKKYPHDRSISDPAAVFLANSHPHPRLAISPSFSSSTMAVQPQGLRWQSGVATTTTYGSVLISLQT
ncbi:hypothetical protein ACOMHN_008744 [Nucella lapillus]